MYGNQEGGMQSWDKYGIVEDGYGMADDHQESERERERNKRWGAPLRWACFMFDPFCIWPLDVVGFVVKTNVNVSQSRLSSAGRL